MKPIISIIIPFYKTPHLLLRKALDCLLEQSFSNFEILVIDDGNKDDYADIKYEYENKDSRIKFIYQENSGVSVARNTGIYNSNGDYIIFHDADDFVENNYLDSLYKGIQMSDLVICGVGAQWYPCVDTYVDIRQFLSSPSQYNYVQYLNFSVNKIFKKDIIINNNIFFDEKVKLGEDALFIASYIRYCNKIRTIPQRLYYYIANPNSATNRYDDRYWEYEEKVISEQMGLFSTYPLSSSEKNFLYHWLYIKIRGALFYYLWWENDKVKQQEMLNKIVSYKNFKFILENKENPYYSKLDRLILLLWDKMGISGIRVSYLMKLIKSYL